MNALSSPSVSLLSQAPFTIIVNSKRFTCNGMGVNSSSVIREFRSKNPNLNEYQYKFDGKSEDFQPICDLFNLKEMNISISNMKALLQITEDLQIDSILEYVTNYNEKFETIVQETEVIDDVFDNLCKLDKTPVETVKKSFLESKMIHSEENIQEFITIILQIINQHLKLHSKIIELLISLNKSAKKENDLNLLMPLFIKQLKSIFYTSVFYCLFAYKMTRENLIPIADIIDEIYRKDPNLSPDADKGDFLNSYHRNVVFVFTPELIEIKKAPINRLFNNMTSSDKKLIESYFPNSIDKYKKMRDLEEPEDDVAKIIILDDVDKLQSIVSNRNNLINKGRIPSNIFDPFDNCVSKSYINFACQCGSIKCFKYLLLNHADIDSYTFGFAIYGNNTEIIHIIEQKMNEYFSIRKNKASDSNWDSKLSNPIYIAIQRHQYDLFDWLLDKKMANKGFNKIYLQNYTDVALYHGNIHAFIRFVDNGLNLNISSRQLENWIDKSALRGFFRQTKMIMSICDCDKYIRSIGTKSTIPIKSGNLSIFKLFYPQKKPRSDYKTLLDYAIKYGHFSIVKYIVNELYEPNGNLSIQSLIKASIESRSNEIFNFLKDKFNFKEQISNCNPESLLITACQMRNFSACKFITDSIYEKNPKADFSIHFINAAKYSWIEYCNYLSDKKVEINLNTVAKNYQFLDKIINKKIFDLIEKSSNEEKEMFITFFFNESIKNGNKELASLLSKYNPMVNDQALFNAVKNHDIELVNLILQNKNDPFFINLVTKEGSALNIAVRNGDLAIVKRLLSIPGINVSLPDQNNNTPLLISIQKFNYEIIFAILDFYGDKIQSQISQINQVIKIIMKDISQQNSSNFIDVLKRLIKVKNIDLNFYQNNRTFLIQACINNNSEIVRVLLESNQVDVNMYELDNFNTPLIISVINENASIAKILIDYPKTNINFSNEKFETALTIASARNQIEIIKLLTKCERFNPVLSNVNYAFYFSKNEVSQLLSQLEGLDVNCSMYKQNQSGLVFETMLSYAINEKQIEKIKIIINHPSFDPQKNNANELIFTDFVLSNVEIFKLLISKLNNNINICSPKGESLFIYVFKKLNKDIINEILNNQSFNPKEEDFIFAFNLIKDKPSLFSLKNDMIEYDKKHKNYLKSSSYSKFNVPFGWAADSTIDILDKIENNSKIEWINGLFPPEEFKQAYTVSNGNSNQFSNWSRIPKKPVFMPQERQQQNSSGRIWGANREEPNRNMQQQNAPRNAWGVRQTNWGNTWGRNREEPNQNMQQRYQMREENHNQENIHINSPLNLITLKSDSYKNVQTIHQPEKPKDACPRMIQRQTTIASNDTQKNSLPQTQKKVTTNDSNQHAKLSNSQHVPSSNSHPITPPQKIATSNNQAQKQTTTAQPNSASSNQTKPSTSAKTSNNQPVPSSNSHQITPPQKQATTTQSNSASSNQTKPSEPTKTSNNQPVSSSSNSHPITPPQKIVTPNNQTQKQTTTTQPNSASSNQTKPSEPAKTNNNQPVSSTNNSQSKSNSAVVKQANNSLNGQAKVNQTQVKNPTTPASSTANQNASASTSQKIIVKKAGEEAKSDLPPINKV